MEEEDAAVERIRRYLEEGGSPHLASVSQSLGMRTSLLRRLQDAGRIALAGEGRQCRACGVPLEPGQVLCRECLRKLGGTQTKARAPERGAAPAQPASSGRPRMYAQDESEPGAKRWGGPSR
jgi:hypothetical protein